MNTKSIIFSSLIISFSFFSTHATDTITTTQILRDNGESLVSSTGRFELGFYGPKNSENRYVGIWYHNLVNQTVVWVANHENPLKNTLGTLTVIEPGVLVLQNSNNSTIWSTNTSTSVQTPVAVLLNSGNLVVKDENDDREDNFLWQSFEYPTDTFLPGMKLGKNFVTGKEVYIRSPKSEDDPASGDYTFTCDPTGYPQMVEKQGGLVKVRSGPWNGKGFSGAPILQRNDVFTYGVVMSEKEVYYHFDMLNDSFLSRFVLDGNGDGSRLNWVERQQEWVPLSKIPRDICDTYNKCGPYGSCSMKNSALCGCLDRFKPSDHQGWEIADWSNGCVRNTPLNCGKGDGFKKYRSIKLPDTRSSSYNESMGLEECKKVCLKNCSCMGYASLDVSRGDSGCLLWFDDLLDIREIDGDRGQDMFIRMASSDSGLLLWHYNHPWATIILACPGLKGISYAKLANLPPIIGLYSSFVPPLIYSVLGSSRHLAVGPVSIASLVMGTMLSETVSFTDEPDLYLQLAFTATFFAGVFQASLGFLRLGFIIDFLSKATLVGFMAGAAVIVSLQQLKGLLGIVHFTTKMQFVPVLSSVFHHRDEWSWQTIAMGVGFLTLLLLTRQISMRKPNLFWVSAAAPLASVILSTILVVCLKSKVHGIKTIGHLPKGLNPPSSNMLYFNGPHLVLAIKTGIITGILSLTEGIAVGRTFASLRNYQVDGNKEMMAIGLMNMAGSCSSCYVTTGSFSRSAVNYNAGAQTVVSNIVMAAAVLVTLLFLMPLFYYTPNLILAAIIITAVIGLIDYQAACKLWRVDKLDFLACLCSFFGVLFISVPLGLAIAVGVSVFKILLNVTRPNIVVLGNIPRTQMYQNLSRYREAIRVPSFLIIAVEAPIYFANSTYIQERVLQWIREEEEWLESNKRSDIKCVILDMTAVTAIDTSGIDTINELRKVLDKRSLKLVLANPVGSVMEKLHGSNSLEAFGLEGLYLSVGEAVSDISSAWKAQP